MLFPQIKRWRSRQPSPGPASRSRKRRWGAHGLRLYQLILGAVVIAVLTYLLPHQRPYNIGELRLGSAAAKRIEAPFLFHVPKSEVELDRDRQTEIRVIPTIVRRDPQVAPYHLARLDSILGILIPRLRVQIPDSLKHQYLKQELPHVIRDLSVGSLDALIDVFSALPEERIQELLTTSHLLLADLYTAGIIASKKEINEVSFNQRVSLDEREFDVGAINSEEALKAGEMIALLERTGIALDRRGMNALHELLGLFLAPNLVIDSQETLRRKKETWHGVPKIKQIYGQGDLIIDKDAKVTQEHIDALSALASKQAEQRRESPITRYLQTLAAAVIAAFITFVFGYYLATREAAVYRQPGHLLLLAIITLATAALASYIRTNELDVYLVPTPLAAMLVTILLNPQIGLVLSFVLSFFIGHLFGDFYIAFTCALTGAIAVYSVRQVRHRNQFYQSMIFLPISYSLLIFAGDNLRFIPLTDSYDHIFIGIITGVAAPILTIGLLPIFESLFNITTDITLLELSDLNTPLLRELAIRAPGTYTHSLIMANLSEGAAEAIGANPLLGRVGCYYHDIGKMLKPDYFAENQGLRGGRNPHDHLTPTMSTLIITSHVKEGLELAEEHGLPKAISDLIPQHHGTTVIEPFYNRAIELGNENARLDDFRYNGPKPQTKVAGILMLADSVESAARTLAERTPNRVRQLVRNIVQQKFTAGELDECDLTLQDLHKIEESFIPVLMGTLHGRVEYPWQKAQKKRRKDLANSP